MTPDSACRELFSFCFERGAVSLVTVLHLILIVLISIYSTFNLVLRLNLLKSSRNDNFTQIYRVCNAIDHTLLSESSERDHLRDRILVPICRLLYGSTASSRSANCQRCL